MLDPEKRNRILQAAYEEFTEHSYKDASTNSYCKKSRNWQRNGSKEELFHYLVDCGLDFIQKSYLGKNEHLTGNFIERCKLLADLKMKAYVEAPYIIEFFAKNYITDEPIELPAGVQEKRKNAIKEAYDKLYSNLDYSLFRSDIPSEELMKMIQWVSDGYEKDITCKTKKNRNII